MLKFLNLFVNFFSGIIQSIFIKFTLKWNFLVSHYTLHIFLIHYEIAKHTGRFATWCFHWIFKSLRARITLIKLNLIIQVKFVTFFMRRSEVVERTERFVIWYFRTNGEITVKKYNKHSDSENAVIFFDFYWRIKRRIVGIRRLIEKKCESLSDRWPHRLL